MRAIGLGCSLSIANNGLLLLTDADASGAGRAAQAEPGLRAGKSWCATYPAGTGHHRQLH